ncbi:MAG TPA: TadE/TadG family type IV pilus assembly protein [Acidimicrobiia bacterium]|nr:TadE/TadG family type IV pilus assembly protein [Acidimicrobiia bacterium]
MDRRAVPSAAARITTLKVMPPCAVPTRARAPKLHRELEPGKRISPPMRRPARGDLISADRGAALVEAAFVMILLLMILLGTVTAGIAFGRSNALQTSAREGSRFGATLPINGTIDDWLDAVRDVAKAAAIGDLQASVPGQHICVAMVHPDGTTRRLVETSGVDSYSDSECFGDGRPSFEQRVQVQVERVTNINAVLFAVDVTIDGSAAARFER